jgi:hypothetical protein
MGGAEIEMPHEQYLSHLQNIKITPDDVKKSYPIQDSFARVAIGSRRGKTYVRLKDCNEALHSKVI